MRNMLKNLYERWMVGRQISACDRMLGQYHAYLGPEHAKEVAAIRNRLLQQRQSCAM